MISSQTIDGVGSYARAFIDGSCLGNPGAGGWAVVLEHDGQSSVHFESSREQRTTNNRMELTAAISALRIAIDRGIGPGRLEIWTDSLYVQQGITKWVAAWIRNEWRTSRGRPVQNRDLGESLLELAERQRPSWNWIRGHSGLSSMHAQADLVAREAALAARP